MLKTKLCLLIPQFGLSQLLGVSLQTDKFTQTGNSVEITSQKPREVMTYDPTSALSVWLRRWKMAPSVHKTDFLQFSLSLSLPWSIYYLRSCLQQMCREAGESLSHHTLANHSAFISEETRTWCCKQVCTTAIRARYKTLHEIVSEWLL